MHIYNIYIYTVAHLVAKQLHTMRSKLNYNRAQGCGGPVRGGWTERGKDRFPLIRLNYLFPCFGSACCFSMYLHYHVKCCP